MFVWLPFYVCLFLSVSVSQSVHMLVCLSICLYVCDCFLCLFDGMYICLSDYINLSTSLSDCLSARLSLCLPVYMFICLSVSVLLSRHTSQAVCSTHTRLFSYLVPCLHIWLLICCLFSSLCNAQIKTDAGLKDKRKATIVIPT